MSTDRFLLVACEGSIPGLLYQEAVKRGVSVTVVTFSFFKSDPVLPRDHVLQTFSLEELFALLSRYEHSNLCLCGKVPRERVLQSRFLDESSLRFLSTRSDWRDGPLLEAVFGQIQQAGYHVLSPLDFLKDLLSRPGLMAGTAPSPEAWEDIRFGFPIARMLADQEVGQTIVVKQKAVLAVEAAEGTDATIKRGGGLTEGQVVAIKAARSKQNELIDFPTVGMGTIKALGEVGGGVLALEAGRALIADLAELEFLAEQNKVSVVGITEQDVL